MHSLCDAWGLLRDFRDAVSRIPENDLQAVPHRNTLHRLFVLEDPYQIRVATAMLLSPAPDTREAHFKGLLPHLSEVDVVLILIRLCLTHSCRRQPLKWPKGPSTLKHTTPMDPSDFGRTDCSAEAALISCCLAPFWYQPQYQLHML